MSHIPSVSESQDCILIVDDTEDNRLLLGTILKSEGYQIAYAVNGIEALKSVTQSPPGLILLDVMMPGIDGIEVTRQIRQDSSLPFIPILLITAYDKPSVVQGLDGGADDFLRKPVEFDELLARVRSLLRLKHSVDERDQIARQREDFVSRLTHDLRTPLIAADRMLTLFQQGVMGELSADMTNAIQMMSRSNKNLLEMVNQLLEVYRYEAGRKELVFTSVNLMALLDEVVQSLAPLASAKGLALQLLPPFTATAPVLTVPGDRLELHRVFTNIIGNAIKFTEVGQITITVERTETAPAQCQVAIQDTGPGISAADQEILFDRFYSGRHRGAGSGLGLYLSQYIITAHAGTIHIQSEVGQGSIFTVQLPLGTEREAPAQP